MRPQSHKPSREEDIHAAGTPSILPLCANQGDCGGFQRVLPSKDSQTGDLLRIIALFQQLSHARKQLVQPLPGDGRN